MIIRVATEAEFEQIHQLNYKTFVREIPQHEQNNSGLLIDKFHFQNTYIIALKENKLIGMVCYNKKRPFSLDEKIADLDSYLPSCPNLAEVRLLALDSKERKTTVAYRLLQYLCTELIKDGIDTAVISGAITQLKLYKAIGFTSFGQLVGKPNAQYQPMFITLNSLRDDFKNG